MPLEPPPFYDDLGLTLARAWDLIELGASDRRAAFHTPGLATVGLDGRPEVRTVVMRAADRASRTLRFHTDRRSAKYAEMERHPFVSLLFYDAGEKVQIRVSGAAHLHAGGSPVGDAAWAGSLPMSRACYAQDVAPGARIAVPIPSPAADLARPLEGLENFVAVVVDIRRVEWLFLFHSGHRRALYEWNDGGESRAWLAP